jgi:ribosomal protein S27E
LISIFGHGKKVLDLPIRGIFLEKITVRCNKCNTNFDYSDPILQNGIVQCPDCSNSQKVLKKSLKMVLNFYEQLLSSIIFAFNEGITIVPFSPFGVLDFQLFKFNKSSNRFQRIKFSKCPDLPFSIAFLPLEFYFLINIKKQG